MARKTTGSLDTAYKRQVINDFAGGLNTYSGALNLASNEWGDGLNVFPTPGRLQYCGGWLQYAGLPAQPDALYAFYDANDAKHIVAWSNGDVYDVVTGVAVLIEAAAYTAGQMIGHVDLNGILYWSTKTVPIRFWNAALATHGAQPQTGADPPPASPLLMIYTNAIVAFGVQYGAAAYQPNVFGWSAINLPGNWTAANSQAVGPNNEFGLSFAIVLGIAEIGVSPFKAFVVGREDQGIYVYSGALGTLSESLVNAPVGCLDGASAQYLPSNEAFGTVIWLGSDGQFWNTNGITAAPLSLKVLPTLANVYGSAVASTPRQRFWSGYNEQYQYYFCNVGAYQFVYKWDLKAFTLFQGWPQGPVVASTDQNGVPVLYAGSGAGAANNLIAQIALPQIDMGGTLPVIQYTSPYLHMGDPELYKEFHWLALFAYDTGTTYSVSAKSLPRPDGSFLQTQPLIFATPNGGGGPPFILDKSLLDVGVLAANTPLIGTGNPIINHGRLSCPYAGTGMLKGIQGLAEQLRGTATQVTIQYSSGTIDFEAIGFEVRFLERGYLREGGKIFNPESGVPSNFAPMDPPLTS